jgi:hypothetical protein
VFPEARTLPAMTTMIDAVQVSALLTTATLAWIYICSAIAAKRK